MDNTQESPEQIPLTLDSDPSGGRKPLYWRLADAIKANIEAGKYARGDLLPSERRLTELFEVSRITVRKALEQIVEEGVVERHGRLGYRVPQHPPGGPTVQDGESGLYQGEAQDLVLCLPFYPKHYHGNRLIEALEGVLVREPFHLVLKNTNEDVNTEIEALSELRERSPGTVLFLPSRPRMAQYGDFLSRLASDCSLIFLDRQVYGADFPYVGSDNTGAIVKAVGELQKAGHRRIAFVGYKGHSAELERFAGYKLGLHLYGLPHDTELVRFEYHLMEINSEYGVVGRESTEELFRLQNPPTAIITVNDFVASGVLKQATELGLSVPGELSLIGFDEDPIAQAIAGAGFSTFRHNYRGLSSNVLALLKGSVPRDMSTRITVAAEYVDYGSVGPPE
jgi:DNA-binding LacI/PurR family transcriptional regulator